MTSIPGYLFGGGTKSYVNLISVTFAGDELETIGSKAFYYCIHLNERKIPEGVKTINSSAFAYCSGATSVVVPSTVKKIGEDAFYSMISLKKIQYDAVECSCSSYGTFEYAGQDGDGIALTIGKNVTNIYINAFSITKT